MGLGRSSLPTAGMAKATLPVRGWPSSMASSQDALATKAKGEDSVQMLVEPENDSLPLMEISTCKTEASEPWDYVLVVNRHTDREHRNIYLQFLENLKRKGFQYEVKDDQKKMFCGIRAESWIFDLYCTLLLEPEDQAPTQRLTPIPPTTR